MRDFIRVLLYAAVAMGGAGFAHLIDGATTRAIESGLLSVCLFVLVWLLDQKLSAAS